MDEVLAQLTPVQQRILTLLGDGKPHSRDELQSCLWDELSGVGAIRMQICRIRPLLKPRGEAIICEYEQGILYYRYVFLSPPGNRYPITNGKT